MSAAESDGSLTPRHNDDEDGEGQSPDRDALNGAPSANNDEDDEDDIVTSSKRRARQPEQRSEPQGDNDDDPDDDAGLFGEGSEEDDADQARLSRRLDDEDLDSGDDEDRNDRAAVDADDDGMDQAEETVQMTIMAADIARHPVPEPSDGELYQLRVPKYLTFEPRPFDPDHFQPPTTDHHSTGPPSSTFNAANVSKTTIRWRRSPSDPSKVESNARILRWSDGSLTLQLASNPTAQYLLPGEPLTQPQFNPPKPTPTTKFAKRLRDRSYREEQESFTYLVSPVVSSSLLRFVGKFSTSLTVQPTESNVDDALVKLKQSMEAAKARGINTEKKVEKGIQLIQIDEDPDLARKRAEQAEKEMLKAERRREQQMARERDRGITKGGRGRTSGLTIGGLEDELGMGPRKSTGRGRPKQRGRRGEIYSDDEEPVGRRGHTKEDEYDEEDDFIAASDEEEMVEEVDDEEDLGLDEDEEDEEEAPSRRKSPERQATPKRARDDAEQESAQTQGSPSTRVKRRRVIEDDDDDE